MILPRTIKSQSPEADKGKHKRSQGVRGEISQSHRRESMAGGLPSVSIVIPVFNSERTLKACLESIRFQDYPKDKIEIIIVDAGSKDQTLDIAQYFKIDKILPNPLKTGEAGKAVGVKATSFDIIALIDSDNIMPQKDWLRRMTEPFSDPEIVGSEPLEYTYRREDNLITRYCALMGMNDPLCMFLGNYDRYNLITGKWTAIKLEEEDKGNYLKISLGNKGLPTIGANGFMIRRELLSEYPFKDYLFDVDIIYHLRLKGKNKYAKVKLGIVHLFSGNISTFFRKQKRRIADYLYFRQQNLRVYPWNAVNLSGLLKFIFYSILVFPLFVQALIGYRRKPDNAWWFHIPACVGTFWIYAIEKIKSYIKTEPLSRKNWGQ